MDCVVVAATTATTTTTTVIEAPDGNNQNACTSAVVVTHDDHHDDHHDDDHDDHDDDHAASPSWVAQLNVGKSGLEVETEGAWSQFSHVHAETTTTTTTIATTTSVTRQNSWVAHLNLEKSTLEVETEGAWSQFSTKAEGTTTKTVVVVDVDDDQLASEEKEEDDDDDEEKEKEKEKEQEKAAQQQQSHVVTLKLAPVIPEPAEWTIAAAGTISSSCHVAPLPSFNDEEKKRHKLLLARLCATRAKQQVFDVVSRLMTTARASTASAAVVSRLMKMTTSAAAASDNDEKYEAGMRIKRRVRQKGCVCTNETCGSYSRLENEAAELLMLEGAQRAVKSSLVNVSEWVDKYVGPGQAQWPVRDDAEEAAMADLGLPPSPLCSVRLVSSYEEHLSLVRRMILGARFTIRIMSCYFFANESPFVEVIKDLLPEAARRGVRVRLMLDALPAQSALIKATMWGPLLTPYVQGSAMRLEFVEFYKRTLPAAAEGCPPGNFRVSFFKATDARGGYAIKSHMKMFGVDGRLAIIGGSNMLPTKATGNNDCDCLVDGEAAAQLDANFREVWLEQTGESLDPPAAAESDAAAAAGAAALAREASSSSINLLLLSSAAASSAAAGVFPPSEAGGVDIQTYPQSHPMETSGEVRWHERGVRFAPIMSRPGIQGEDAILRAVIGLVDSAREEFLMCMGFCALHTPLVAALTRASRRGVRVRLLLNSHYSCDLRPPMSDLVAGARALLLAAPDVELYMTGPREAWDVREEETSGAVPPFVPKYPVAASGGAGAAQGGEEGGQGNAPLQPPPYSHPFTFVHGKYCVADRRRCSVGSWNAWARSAFHEAEMNVMVESAALGEELAQKWGEAARLHAARVRDAAALAPGGSSFAPSGCNLCAPFGGFCADAVERATNGTLPLAETA